MSLQLSVKVLSTVQKKKKVEWEQLSVLSEVVNKRLWAFTGTHPAFKEGAGLVEKTPARVDLPRTTLSPASTGVTGKVMRGSFGFHGEKKGNINK